jgi:hypothetical protein
MRKYLWIIPLLFAAIGAPNAHADTYDVTFTCPGLCPEPPTATAPVSTPFSFLYISVGGVPFSVGLVGDLPGDAYAWNEDVTLGTEAFDLVDMTAGQVLSTCYSADVCEGGAVLFSPAPTPEPSSMLLFGTGLLGLAVLFRRRCALRGGI